MAVRTNVASTFEVVFLCVFIVITTTRADTALPSDALFNQLCGGIDDEATVQVFVSLVNQGGGGFGTDVDICAATEWFVEFIEGAVDPGLVPDNLDDIIQRRPPVLEADFSRFRMGQLTPIPQGDRPVACDDPDFVQAFLSNTIPDSESLCDITMEYLGLFAPPPDGTARFFCFPPPMYCYASGKRRRLLGFASHGQSIRSAASSGSSISIKGGSFGVSGKSSASVGPHEKPRKVGAFTQKSREVALTACKGECCVTTVLKGNMSGRTLDLVPKHLCPAFSGPTYSGSNSITTIVNSSGGAGASASASSSSSMTVTSSLPIAPFHLGVGNHP